MHYHCEIVIPPTPEDQIVDVIAKVLEPFNENQEDQENARHAFWDFWSLGGRFAGTKRLAHYDAARLDEFHAWLVAQKVTVSGLQCGKQELQPASQRGMVDEKWNEMFPSAKFVACPLFAHSNDRYNKAIEGILEGDVQPLADVAPQLTCARVIFATPSFTGSTWDGPPEAQFMLAEEIWNGCNHMPIAWDRTFGDALRQYREKFKSYSDEYKARALLKDDWLVATVDYHS